MRLRTPDGQILDMIRTSETPQEIDTRTQQERAAEQRVAAATNVADYLTALRQQPLASLGHMAGATPKASKWAEMGSNDTTGRWVPKNSADFIGQEVRGFKESKMVERIYDGTRNFPYLDQIINFLSKFDRFIGRRGKIPPCYSVKEVGSTLLPATTTRLRSRAAILLRV